MKASPTLIEFITGLRPPSNSGWAREAVGSAPSSRRRTVQESRTTVTGGAHERAVGRTFVGKLVDECTVGEPSSRRSCRTHWAEGDKVAFSPGDLVAGPDTEHVTKVLRENNLPFGVNLVCHAWRYGSSSNDRNEFTRSPSVRCATPSMNRRKRRCAGGRTARPRWVVGRLRLQGDEGPRSDGVGAQCLPHDVGLGDTVTLGSLLEQIHEFVIHCGVDGR